MAVDPEAQKLLSVLPTAPNASGSILVNGISIPTGGTALFSPFFVKEHDVQFNTDYKLNAHQISARFLFSNQSTIYPVTTPQSQFNQPGINNNRKIALTDSWVISPRYVNDLRLSYSRFLQQIATPAQFDSYNTYHLRDLNNLTIGPNDTQRNMQNEYQILDNQTFEVNRHTLKWGAEYRHYIAPAFFLCDLTASMTTQPPRNWSTIWSPVTPVLHYGVQVLHCSARIRTASTGLCRTT